MACSLRCSFSMDCVYMAVGQGGAGNNINMSILVCLNFLLIGYDIYLLQDEKSILLLLIATKIVIFEEVSY